MFYKPDYTHTLSIKLSEVLEDIGVNERLVVKRRRVKLLRETIGTISDRLFDDNRSLYYLGSQSEGTTTLGLNSDVDILSIDHEYNVIQYWSEWKHNKTNFLIVQDLNATPGYCFLQLLRSDVPLPATHIPDQHYISDRQGRILLKNDFFTTECKDFVKQGPSNSITVLDGSCDLDLVIGIPCNSWPQSASDFLDRQGIGRWRSPEMINYAASNGCFVVGANSRVSTYPEIEWRISTCLAERCLMYNLNITQIQCYVLLKIILKTFLNPQKENRMSSFMCKCVLLHCVETTPKRLWKKNNLSTTCLTYCLLKLHSFVQNDFCPHFIIPENNLMAGQFTDEMKRDLLREIRSIIQDDCRHLLRICIDDIGDRLGIKLTSLLNIGQNFQSPQTIYEKCLTELYIGLTSDLGVFQLKFRSFKHHNTKEKLKQHICNLKHYIENGIIKDQLAFRLVLPFYCCTIGSIMASYSIEEHSPVSAEAIKWMSLGLNSDVTSSRLKVASLFIDMGEMNRAEFILKQIERQYHIGTVIPVCGCQPQLLEGPSPKFKRICSENSEVCIKFNTSFCLKFHRSEFFYVPSELRYELMKQNDRNNSSLYDDVWTDFVAVDSLPYLYFLQYKTYGCLQKPQDQQRALNKLMKTTFTYRYLGHRETAMNLLGHCMKEKDKPREALLCYFLSLREKPNNNAGKCHIWSLCAKYVYGS